MVRLQAIEHSAPVLLPFLSVRKMSVVLFASEVKLLGPLALQNLQIRLEYDMDF